MPANRVNSLIPKVNLKRIFEYLMREGTLVCKKDPKAPKHLEIDVPNLHVMMTMKTLKSKNYVSENYTWRYYYYVLNNEGIEYLRDYLQVPATVTPETLTQKARPQRAAPRDGGMGRRGGDRMGGGEEGQWRSDGPARGMGRGTYGAQ
eukprot:Gregarina_sp_Poly_1__1539@NODE_138_length_13117_cov_118_636935_g123_i0_p7_GENE_NODE_138_length_13117_cov_118_636935_g123_i0NODE_138_length_13117_cov_118_636935_g123_i0_p7_ORF_typecomplete_len148_score17_79S10_plectin/PF03501_15/3_8e36_NODE_138_length_13117_cov_118_636935_g123_i092535